MLHEEGESPGQQSGAGEPIAKNSSRRCLLAACSARPPCAKLPPFPLSIGEFSSRCTRLLSCFSNLSSRVHERDRRGPQCTRRKAGERAKKARRSISFFFAVVSDSRGRGGGGGGERRGKGFPSILPYLQGVDVGVDGVERALGLGGLDERGGVRRADLLHAAGLGEVGKEMRKRFFFSWS